MPERWGVVLTLLPLAVFSRWGWYAETRHVISASRDLRTGRPRSSPGGRPPALSFGPATTQGQPPATPRAETSACAERSASTPS